MGRLTIVELPRRAGPDLACDTLRGLSSCPKRLPAAHFYDDAGSRLFEEITDCPEYYLTRTELSILRRRGESIVGELRGPLTLVELGSGSSKKTRALIEPILARQGALHYVALDISRGALLEAAEGLLRDYPALTMTACAGDYGSGLSWLAGRRLEHPVGLLLGSSIGNMDGRSARRLLAGLSRRVEAVILGADLRKDIAVVEAAYNDSAGVTARFNLNLLLRINAELGGRFDPAAFRHLAFYHARRGAVEMHLESLRDQEVSVAALGRSFRFAPGERIHTEDSRKYTKDQLEALARRAGWSSSRLWADERGWYGVLLLERAASQDRHAPGP